VAVHWGGLHAIGGGAGDHDEKWDPQTREVADHSMAYLVAVALVDGDVTVDSFSEARISDPALRPLMQKIVVIDDPELTAEHAGELPRWPSRVELVLKDGRRLGRASGPPKGHPLNPHGRSRTGSQVLAHGRPRPAPRTRPDLARNPVVLRRPGRHPPPDEPVPQPRRPRRLKPAMPTMPAPCILFLSGASLVGQNILSTLAGRRAGLHLAAINSVANEPALFDFDEAFLAGNLKDDPDAFGQRFDQIVEGLQPRLVIPCRDDDVAWLAARAQARPNPALPFLCGAPGPALAMLDKAASATLSTRHGLPYAATLATDTDAARLIDFAARHGYPLIAKPRQGFASRGVFLVQNDIQLARLAGRPDTILQRYLGDRAEVQAYLDGIARDGIPLFHSFEADKHSIQAFIAPDGSLKGLLATRHAMRQGRSERVARNDDPTLLQLGQRCAQAFAAEGWRGPLNIQCQRTPEGDYAIYEYNGRYTRRHRRPPAAGLRRSGHGAGTLRRHPAAGKHGAARLADAVQRLPVSRRWKRAGRKRWNGRGTGRGNGRGPPRPRGVERIQPHPQTPSGRSGSRPP
jgi:hypothetical protein